MKQTLFLTSDGIRNELKNDFLESLSKKPHKCKVSFVTTAGYGAEVYKQEFVEEHKKELTQCGIKSIEEFDLRDRTQEEVENELSDKDIIFVGGGNTFYLLYWVRKSGFDKLLPKFLEAGKLYVGVSASSYIVCPTIEAATWKHPSNNKIGLKDLTGLNLVPFLISAHFEEKYRSVIKTAAKATKYPIVALYDTQAVFVEDTKYKVVGKGGKEFFNGFK